MPIKACADRLKNETELYGAPPVVPEEEPEAAPAEAEAGSAGGEGAKKKTKGKVAAKKTKGTTQWEILKNSGIPEEDIPKFQCAPATLLVLPVANKQYCSRTEHLGQQLDAVQDILYFDQVES